MPRKAFLADLADVSKGNIPGVSNIVKGAEDGEIEFTYTPSTGAEPISVAILSGDVSEYPGMGNPFFLSTSSDTAPKAVSEILERHAETSLGMTIEQLLSSLASAFRQVYSIETHKNPFNLDDDGDTQMEDEGVYGSEEENYEEGDEPEEDEEPDYDLYPDFSDDDDGFDGGPIKIDAATALKINGRIRQDLQAAKQAGFKVGIVHGMTAESNNSILSLSIRVSKLGLSDEAMQAWDLKKDQYVILLTRYAIGYKNFEFIEANGVSKDSNGVEFRVGLCSHYKPTRLEAMAAFSDAKREVTSSKDEKMNDEESTISSGYSNIFISSSLNDLMNSRFISMMKCRVKLGVSWDGAKEVYNKVQGTGSGEYPEHLEDHCFQNDIPENKVLPEIALADHLTATTSDRSFPLVAMQFMLRYLIRCPEFCLICHDKTTETFEALKPYVCSRGLCLFQYMQLGFGPSIEHEIITQPYVVDLLISFCYAAAKMRRIRTYPLGQWIFVPPKSEAEKAKEVAYPPQYQTYMNRALPAVASAETPATPQEPAKFWSVKYDSVRHEVTFDGPDSVRGDINVNEWVVLDVADCEPVHFRVIDVSTYPTIQLSETGITRSLHPPGNLDENLGKKVAASASAQTPAITPPPSLPIAARLSKYDRQFDKLSDYDKADSIAMLLETLPRVTEMRDYLRKEFNVKEPKLSNWTERVTAPALTLLRWIISSNRSIICQVDGIPGQTEKEVANSGVRLDDKVTGMENYIQFRFAQGAPDKEQRFIDSLSKMQQKLNAKCPTLFAWHGSALQNWHSIIRSGLDYKESINGRAFGNGCYFSQDLNYSLAYANRGVEGIVWPKSQLQITTALAMAEIVNAPNEFASKNPHFVVQHVDWIQCRYLFVSSHKIEGYNYNDAQPIVKNIPSTSASQIAYIDQDSTYQIKNSMHQVVGIPVHAIPSRKTLGMVTTPPRASAQVLSEYSSGLVATSSNPKKKKQKTSGKQKELPELPDRAYETDETDAEDRAFLTRSDSTQSPNGKRKAALDSQTDFILGTLDRNSLQIMAAPSYATSMASKQLSRALKEAIKVQNEAPLHELGWTINEQDGDNLYQWIVELHSFDPDLPLAKDMKKAEVKSIVMEILFGREFPHTPPFIRVIRPRFLPFMNGGGGHVTAGGALCMQLLTNSGWSAVNTIESVLMQVRLAISSTDPRPARLQSTDKNTQADYRVGEAMDAFIRACNTHGWKVPSDFGELKASASASGM